MCNCNTRPLVINVKGVFTHENRCLQADTTVTLLFGMAQPMEGTTAQGECLPHAIPAQVLWTSLQCFLFWSTTRFFLLSLAEAGTASTARHKPLAAWDQGTQKPREEHLSPITAKLLLCLQQRRAWKFPHTEHLPLADVVGNHQKHSKTSSHPNSTLRWAATAASKLQAGTDRNEGWV